MWPGYLRQQTTWSRSVLSESVGADDKIDVNNYHTHTDTYTLVHFYSHTLLPQLAGCHRMEVDTWIWGQVGTHGHLTFLSLDNLEAPFVLFHPPHFRSFRLCPAVGDSPHVKTDLVAGRILVLCVPAAVIAVVWWLSLTHWVTYLPDVSLRFTLFCSCSRLSVHIFICLFIA